MTRHQVRLACCPACRQFGPPLPLARLPHLHVHGCQVCGHRYLDLEEAELNVQELYDEAYSGFVIDPLLLAAFRRELQSNLAPKLTAGARMLDIGCGNGMFLRCAKEAGFDAEGIDISEAAVERCEQQGLKARCGLIVNLVPEAPTFDCMTMWDVLEHLPDPSEVLARLAKGLRPGGLLVLKVPWVHDWIYRFGGVAPAFLRSLTKAPSHVQFFTESSLKRLLRRSGFAVAEWRWTGPLRTKPPLFTRRIQRIPGRVLSRAASATGLADNILVTARRD